MSLLSLNGKQQAEAKMEDSAPFRFASYAGMDIGTDNGLPVVPKFEYAKVLPKYFRGTNRKSRIRSRPGKTKCRRSPTDSSPTLRQRSSKLKGGELARPSPIENRQSPTTDAKQRPGFPIENYVSRQSDSNRRPADYKPREESGVCHNFPRRLRSSTALCNLR